MTVPVIIVVTAVLSMLSIGGHAQECGSQAGGALCANNLCCSQYGWCGTTSDYCGTGCQNQCGSTAVCGSQAGGALCANNNCCSQYGYCGTTFAYCGTGCQSQCGSTAVCGSQAGGALCANNNCCSQYGYCGTTSDYCGTGCQSQCGSTGGISSIISSSTFSSFFPYMNSFYSYNSFIDAASSFPAFGTTGTTADRQREVAAFLANVKQETGGLQYIQEINPQSTYCDSSNTQYPCASGKSYHGRGPLQLSWNYNYGAAGSYLGLSSLLSNPDLLAQDAGDSFKAAFWFWTQSPSTSGSCHQAMVGGSGFGQTIRIINGGYECDKGSETTAASNRISYYQSLCSMLGVSPGNNLSCA